MLSSGSDKKKVAEDLLKAREGDVANGFAITADVGKIRFEEAAADLVTDYRTNQRRSLRTLTLRIEKHLARKFDGSKKRGYPGRPPVDRALQNLIIRLATENRDWGYDRIAGALANLGHEVSDQTVGNILKRHGIPTAPVPAVERAHLLVFLFSGLFLYAFIPAS